MRSAEAQQGCSDCLSMNEVAREIQNGGIEAFIRFIDDPSYGANFFLREIDNTTTRGNNRLVPAPVRFSLRAASWGHTNFPNPDYDELRHIVMSFLATHRYGVNIARDLTMGNEMIGLWLDITTGGEGTAFEWRDVFNNEKGIGLRLDKYPAAATYPR